MKTILDAEKIALNLFTYNPTHSSQKPFHAIVLECHRNSGTKETYFCWIQKNHRLQIQDFEAHMFLFKADSILWCYDVFPVIKKRIYRLTFSHSSSLVGN